MKYRREIDGLRAVAVLPVLLYHAGFGLFSGGFVGVDVFFVISGYLITTLIVLEKQAGRFSILTFYERRARRILPALLLVIVVSTPLAIAVMLPSDLRVFSESVIATLLFVPNVFFWSQGGYFAGPNELVPLLHTWSLGVEEQYYLFFPLFILLAWRWIGLRAIAVLIALVALGSLGLADWWSKAHPTANFYLLPTRAWELLVGSLLAVYLVKRPQPVGRVGNIAAVIGLLLVFYAIFTFDEATPFPSLWAAIPVGGTALIILFCTPKTWVYRILSLPLVVGLGLISYSTYLWHQPLLAFARIRFGELSPVVLLGLLLLSILLAWASWRYVERPFRNRKMFSRGQIFGMSLGASAVLAAFAGYVVVENGFSGRYPDWQQQLVAQTRAERGAYVNGRYNREVKDRPFSSSSPKLLIIGDSFSQDFYNEILETGAFANFQISATYIPTKCQTYLYSDRHLQPDLPAICQYQRIDDRVLKRVEQADIVILAASWKLWAAQALPETIANLGLREDQRLFVIGTKGFGRYTMRELVNLSRPELFAQTRDPGPNRVGPNKIMKETLPEDIFVDVLGTLCGVPAQCPLFTPDGDLISYDGSHLTRAGARYVGQRLFEETPLREFLPLENAPDSK